MNSLFFRKFQCLFLLMLFECIYPVLFFILYKYRLYTCFLVFFFHLFLGGLSVSAFWNQCIKSHYVGVPWISQSPWAIFSGSPKESRSRSAETWVDSSRRLPHTELGTRGTRAIVPSLGCMNGWARVGMFELTFTVCELCDLQQINYLTSWRLGFFVSWE